MKRSLMLAPLLLALAAGCDGDGSSLPDIDARMVDAPLVDGRPLIDSPTDASLIDGPLMTDAGAGSIATACMHACAAIGVCAMGNDPSCVGECSADLADCSAQQVQAVDACSTQACGDISNENTSPLFMCLAAIACIDM